MSWKESDGEWAALSERARCTWCWRGKEREGGRSLKEAVGSAVEGGTVGDAGGWQSGGQCAGARGRGVSERVEVYSIVGVLVARRRCAEGQRVSTSGERLGERCLLGTCRGSRRRR